MPVRDYDKNPRAGMKFNMTGSGHSILRTISKVQTNLLKEEQPKPVQPTPTAKSGVFSYRPRRQPPYEATASVLFTKPNPLTFKESKLDVDFTPELEQCYSAKYPPPSSPPVNQKHASRKYEDPAKRRQAIKELRSMLTKVLDDSNKAIEIEEEDTSESDSLTSTIEDFDELEQQLNENSCIADPMEPRYTERSRRPYWIDPDTGEHRCLPPTPAFIRKLRVIPKDDAMARLKRFHENEKWTMAKRRISKKPASLSKMNESQPGKLFYPHMYDNELINVLEAETAAKVTTRKQREDIRTQLKKRDNILAYELGVMEQTQKELLERASKYDAITKAYALKLLASSRSSKKKQLQGLQGFTGLADGENAIIYGDGLKLALERRDTLLATLGSKSSTPTLPRAVRVHSCKTFLNLAEVTSSGHLAASDTESQFSKNSMGTIRGNKQLNTFHRLTEARQQLLKDESTKKGKSTNLGKNFRREIKFLKDPKPTAEEAESEDEREFTEEDLAFLRELREKHIINEGDCGLTQPDDEVDTNLQQSEEVLHPRVIVKVPKEPNTEQWNDYNIAMTIFPRRGPGIYTSCRDPFDPEFWKGFCVNKYLLESNAGPIDPETGKPKFLKFLRHVFQVKRFEDAHPDDKTPEVLYYRLLPSQLGLKGIRDPEQIPKPVSGNTAVGRIPNNSPVSSSSPEPFIIWYKEFKYKDADVTTSAGYKTIEEQSLTHYPTRLKKAMAGVEAIKRNKELQKDMWVNELVKIAKREKTRSKSRTARDEMLEISSKDLKEMDTIGSKAMLEKLRNAGKIRPAKTTNKRFPKLTDSLLLVTSKSGVKPLKRRSRKSSKSLPGVPLKSSLGRGPTGLPLETKDYAGRVNKASTNGKSEEREGSTLDRRHMLDSPVSEILTQTKSFSLAPKPIKSCLKKSTMYPASSEKVAKKQF